MKIMSRSSPAGQRSWAAWLRAPRFVKGASLCERFSRKTHSRQGQRPDSPSVRGALLFKDLMGSQHRPPPWRRVLRHPRGRGAGPVVDGARRAFRLFEELVFVNADGRRTRGRSQTVDFSEDYFRSRTFPSEPALFSSGSEGPSSCPCSVALGRVPTWAPGPVGVGAKGRPASRTCPLILPRFDFHASVSHDQSLAFASKAHLLGTRGRG